MKRSILFVALMAPSVCMASGDPAIIWWAASAALAYLAVAALLILYLVRREVRWPRLVIFFVLAAAAWYRYANTTTDNLAIESIILIVIALAFLLRPRRQT